MYKTFDTWFEFYKRTVVHHIDDFARIDRTDWVFLFDVVPWVRQQLLHTQRDFRFFAVDVENFDFDFLIHGNHFRWVRNSSVRHVGDMQKTVDSAKINKRTKVGDVLDDTCADLAFDQIGQQFLLCILTFFFDQASTADHDIPSLVVDLKNFTLYDAADVFTNVAWTSNVDL